MKLSRDKSSKSGQVPSILTTNDLINGKWHFSIIIRIISKNSEQNINNGSSSVNVSIIQTWLNNERF